MLNRKCFITGIKGKKLSSPEIFFLKKYKPWGVILFSRNLNNVKQIKKLTSHIKKIFKDKNYPIMIDQEGGRVNRLTNFLNNDLSTGEFFGNLYSKDRKIFNVKYNEFITETANHLKLIGVNLNTVPVLDLRLKGSSSIIGDRSFSHDPKVVSRIGDICIENFHKNKIGTIMKHIPGHGLAKVDSHKLTPTIKQNLKYLSKKDFIPFKNKRCLFGMTAHIVYSHIDKVYTATHSKKVIDIIRKKIKFQNILLSDDISMKSLKFSIKDNTIKAFSAGCDLVLHCNGNLKEMKAVAINSPFLNKFIIKKTSQFYKIIS